MEERTEYQLQSLPTEQIPPTPPARQERTWPAVLSLYFIAPFIAEMLTGSTPPLQWNNVGGVIMTIGLYGSGAVLARELVRRRGLGWSSLALLGAAYGVLEEGLAFQTWFSPTYLNPPDRLRLFEVNWTLALFATTIHVGLSIMSSVVIAETLFPRIAARPWLSQRGTAGFTIWLLIIALFNSVTRCFLWYQGKSLFSVGIALLFIILFFWLGTRQSTRPASVATGTRNALRPAPPLWALRLAAFMATLCWVCLGCFVRMLMPIALLPFVIMAGVDLVGVLLLLRWSQRSGWDASHRLALTSGVMGCFVFFSPIFEFVLHLKLGFGLTLVNLFALGGLIWLARRTAPKETERTARAI